MLPQRFIRLSLLEKARRDISFRRVCSFLKSHRSVWEHSGGGDGGGAAEYVSPPSSRLFLSSIEVTFFVVARHDTNAVSAAPVMEGYPSRLLLLSPPEPLQPHASAAARRHRRPRPVPASCTSLRGAWGIRGHCLSNGLYERRFVVRQREARGRRPPEPPDGVHRAFLEAQGSLQIRAAQSVHRLALPAGGRCRVVEPCCPLAVLGHPSTECITVPSGSERPTVQRRKAVCQKRPSRSRTRSRCFQRQSTGGCEEACASLNAQIQSASGVLCLRCPLKVCHGLLRVRWDAWTG